MTHEFFQGLFEKQNAIAAQRRALPYEPMETERLRIRPVARGDFEAHMAFYLTERARWHGGGPEEGEGRAWRIFAILLGQWQIHGYGPYALIEKASGRLVGGMGPFFPANWPECELGWSIFNAEDEGRGFATEAGHAILHRLVVEMKLPSLVSYIDPENTRSAALAKRLGATLDPDAARPAPADLVYRHKGAA